MRPLRPPSDGRAVGRLTGRTRALERRVATGGPSASAVWTEFEEPFDDDWENNEGGYLPFAWTVENEVPYVRGSIIGGVSGSSPGAVPGAPFAGTTVSAAALTNGDGLAITIIDGDTGVVTIYLFEPDGYAPGGTDVAIDDGGTGASSVSAARTNLGLEIGADVQAFHAKLAALVALTWAADKVVYLTGTSTVATTDLSSFIRGLLDDGDAATARATLGVVASLFQSGGAQAIKLDDLGTPDDNTDLNASTSRHGLLPKLPGGSTNFLREDGTFAAPPSGGVVAAEDVTVTPFGGIGATNAQDALEEIYAEAGGGGSLIVPEFRSSNTVLDAGDLGKAIHFTASFTQTLDDAATLGAGWWAILKNATTDGATAVTVEPDGAEEVDGLDEMVMYSGEERLLICDGSGFVTLARHGGFVELDAAGPVNVVIPAGVEFGRLIAYGAGIGGGGGAGGAAGSTRLGGTGGAAGGRIERVFRWADLGAPGDTVTLTVGAGSAGGTGGTSGVGSAAAAAGNTTFGPFTAYAGGRSFGGITTATQVHGPGGGGTGEKGQDAANDGNGKRGGGNPNPGGTSPFVGFGVGEQGSGTGQNASNAWPAEDGGGAGASNSSGGANGFNGGTSMRGAAGGGAGGSLPAANTQRTGGTGGATGVWTLSGGGSITGTGGTTGGGNGGNGADGEGDKGGEGGGGGGSNASGTGGTGGTGGKRGGGGGGGGAGTPTGGPGGPGGDGYGRVEFE